MSTDPRPSTDEIDRRVDAVLEVIRGSSSADVAARLGVERALVDRWLDLFLSGGRDRLLGKVDTGEEHRDRFLAMTAHEFLTPLTIIRGWAETLLQVEDVPAETRAAALSSLARNAVHLERIARDVLDSAAVALGRFRLVLAPTDVRALCEEVVGELGAADVRLAPGDELVIHADRQRLAQILTNLLSNALRHGGPGGVEVGIAPVAAGTRVRIDISSDGAIDPETALDLFEPWVRRGDSGGLGLGLYVCRALVVAHGGLIGVDGDDDRTTFWFEVPVAGPPAALLIDDGTLQQRSAPTPAPLRAART